MEIVVMLIIALVGVVGFALLMRHYRRQRDWEEPPGKVPEDYS